MTWVQQTLYSTTGLMTLMASAYESKAFSLAKLFTPVASFAGDTSQTLTDGSINKDPGTIKSATSNLANQANVTAAGYAAKDRGTAKPLVVKVTQRNLWDAEITGDAATAPYKIYTADGTDVSGRYEINRITGEIYAATDAYDLHDGISWITGSIGRTAVVGMLEFRPLEGGALNSVQEEISELSGVIQPLSSLIRSQKDTNKGLLNVIR